MAVSIGASYCFDLKMNGLPPKFKCYHVFSKHTLSGYPLPSSWLLKGKPDLPGSEINGCAPTSCCSRTGHTPSLKASAHKNSSVGLVVARQACPPKPWRRLGTAAELGRWAPYDLTLILCLNIIDSKMVPFRIPCMEDI